jgi:nicotinamide-nucleotide amidase
MHAEIIAIGSELTTGAKLDTNSQWLSIELSAVGIPVFYHTTIADNLEANVAAFRIAIERADLVLITGGLGPTLDDLTRQALADVLNASLVLHEPSLRIIREMFSRRNRVMPERNVAQAMFPEGTEPIPNPRGTAPGIWLEVPRAGGRPPCQLAAMPGVPSEMKPMFAESVLPRLQWPEAEGGCIRRARLNSFGLGESHAEELLGDLTARGRDPEVGITVHEATITLRIEAHGHSVAECDAKIAAARATAYERLGTAIFGEEDEELQDIVVRLLNERGLTLSTAEAGTGGLAAHWVSGVPGAEQCFSGGAVTPNAAAKHDWLQLDPDWLNSAGSGSGEVAAALAARCRERAGSDFALAVGDCPRHEAESVASQGPTAWIALAHAAGVETREVLHLGDFSILKSRLAKSALNLLRLHLLNSET